MKRVLKSSAAILCIGLSMTSFGQSVISTYNFNRVSEFHMMNPSAYQPYRTVVSVPMLGMQSINIHNDGFDIAPVITPGLTGNEAIEYVLDNAQTGDRFLMNHEMDMLYIGFRWGKGFWSFGAQMKNQLSLEYPIDLARLAWYGSVPVGDKLNMSNNETTLNSYLAYHLGYQRELMEGKLRVGGRFKYLSGLAHFSSSSTTVNATFNSDYWSFDTDIESRAAMVVDPNNGEFNGVGGFVFSDNAGVAFDLGASYEVIPKLEVSIAALDLGFINWNTNSKIYTSKGSYTWSGMDYSYNHGTDFNNDSLLNDLVDAMNFKENSGESFNSTLPMNFVLGANYQWYDKHAFAATYQLNQWGSRSYSSFGVSYIGTWSKWFSFYTNYAILDSDKLNVGVGFSLNLGPVQLYMLTDDVMSTQLLSESPKNVNMANLRFGLNVALYRKDLKGYSKAPDMIIIPVSEEVNTTKEN